LIRTNYVIETKTNDELFEEGFPASGPEGSAVSAAITFPVILGAN
jgi:hypothetical protein